MHGLLQKRNSSPAQNRGFLSGFYFKKLQKQFYSYGPSAEKSVSVVLVSYAEESLTYIPIKLFFVNS
jgi:hypothetical protein